MWHFVSATVISATQFSRPPVFPMCLYGNVTIDEKPAIDGTIIFTKIDDEMRGNASVKNGKYGEHAWDRLIINGHEEDEGKIIQFYINSKLAKETLMWHSGCINQLDLTFTTSTNQITVKIKDSKAGRIAKLENDENISKIEAASNGAAGGLGGIFEPESFEPESASNFTHLNLLLVFSVFSFISAIFFFYFFIIRSK